MASLERQKAKEARAARKLREGIDKLAQGKPVAEWVALEVLDIHGVRSDSLILEQLHKKLDEAEGREHKLQGVRMASIATHAAAQLLRSRA